MQDFLNAIYDMLMYVPLKLYELLLGGLSAVLAAIPVPDWAVNVGSYAGSISTNVMYFIAPFNIGTGLAIMMSAYGIRFLIRRIPFIG